MGPCADSLRGVDFLDESLDQVFVAFLLVLGLVFFRGGNELLARIGRTYNYLRRLRRCDTP